MNKFFAIAPLALFAAGTSVVAMAQPRVQVDTYRAVGTEPFWDLTITSREMTFDDLNGDDQIVQRTPRPTIGVAGEIYQTQRLSVNVVHAQCSDGMSERVYPDKVQVTVEGKRLEGCGGPGIEPVMLSTTEWRVISVNGRPTPGSQAFYANFDAEHLTAKFGCNRFNAKYELTSDTLTAGPVGATRTACRDMSFESQASAILSRPMRTGFLSGDRLILANGAGKIELKRRVF